MLRRKTYEKLSEWKQQKQKKALCIVGARQIGKTTLIREFGRREYDCFVEIKSYPVGYEEIYPMYPLDLEEFLWANGVQESTIHYLEECFRKTKRVSDSVHETLCERIG